MHVSGSARFGDGSARFFSSLRMPRSSDSDLQQSSKEGIASENAKNALMDVKEEEEILDAARAFNGEDVPPSKKRGRPSKGRKASALPKKQKSSAKKAARKEKDLLGSGRITRSKH